VPLRAQFRSGLLSLPRRSGTDPRGLFEHGGAHTDRGPLNP